MSVFSVIGQQATRFTTIIIILATLIAIIAPEIFSWVRGDIQLLLVGVVMLGMGITLGKKRL